MTTKPTLENTFMRVSIDGKWGSHSLQELCDRGSTRTAMMWLLDRLLEASYKPDVTEQMLNDALNLLDQYKKI